MTLDSFNLDRLTSLPASEAIGGEATAFTPWLATHIDLLSAALGIGLHVGDDDDPSRILKENTEVPVGNYRLDIQASTDDGRVVVIENQYGWSDHSHLGQIITYASGVGADVVVWIAEHFTEPHLAALRWLNERTDSDCGVFAIEIAFYRIGPSAPAPRLTRLVEPSEWQRTARRASVAASDWTIEDFIDAITDAKDRETASALINRTIEHGGGVWCGRRPGGYLMLHPIKEHHSTLGLWLNSKGETQVSGLWTAFTDTNRHPAYQPVADILGLPLEGPAGSVPMKHLELEPLWNAALRAAQDLPAAKRTYL